eukprot:6026330-Pyramimonas_sp.AAC.1
MQKLKCPTRLSKASREFGLGMQSSPENPKVHGLNSALFVLLPNSNDNGFPNRGNDVQSVRGSLLALISASGTSLGHCLCDDVRLVWEIGTLRREFGVDGVQQQKEVPHPAGGRDHIKRCRGHAKVAESKH